MAQSQAQDFRDLLKQANDETDRIAARIAELMAGIKPNMSDDEVAEIKAGLQAEVDKLKGVGVVQQP